MTRKEIKNDTGKTVFYITDGDINVSAIISELSSMGCKGDELGAAYRKLNSEDKGYFYENKDAKEKLIVIDERTLNFDFKGSPFLLLIWAFFATRLFGNPYDGFIQELKKGGEEIK